MSDEHDSDECPLDGDCYLCRGVRGEIAGATYGGVAMIEAGGGVFMRQLAGPPEKDHDWTDDDGDWG